jgi:DICT domain-containing protein
VNQPTTIGQHPLGLDQLTFTDGLDPSTLRLHSRTIMIALSHLIEEHAAAAGPETVLVATFQRLSLLRPEVVRYAELAPRIGRVYALGVADVPPPEIPGVTVLALDAAWPLAQEWNVVVSGPRISMALLARDAEGFRMERRSQRFRGCWISDRAAVDAALAQFFQAINVPAPAAGHDTQATFSSTRAMRAALAQLYRYG